MPNNDMYRAAWHAQHYFQPSAQDLELTQLWRGEAASVTRAVSQSAGVVTFSGLNARRSARTHRTGPATRVREQAIVRLSGHAIVILSSGSALRATKASKSR